MSELDLDALDEALQTIRELHCACTECEGNGRRGWCHCCDATYPCATVRALDAALDGNEASE